MTGELAPVVQRHEEPVPDQVRVHAPHTLLQGLVQLKREGRQQGVTKRCRLSLLTNSVLVIRVPMRGRGGSSGVSANEYSCAHHVTWSPNKLWRSTSIFNLWLSVSGT